MDSKRPPNCICPAAQCTCKKKAKAPLGSDIYYDTVEDPTNLKEISSSLGRTTTKTKNDYDTDHSNLTDQTIYYDPRQEPVKYYDASSEEIMKTARSMNERDNDNYSDKKGSPSPLDNFVLPDGSGLRVNVSQGGISVTATPKRSNQSAMVKLSFGNQCPILRGSYECFPKDGDDGGFECRPRSATTYYSDANEMSNGDYEFFGVSRSLPAGISNQLEEPATIPSLPILKASDLQDQASLPSGRVFEEDTGNLRPLDQQVQTGRSLLNLEQSAGSKLEVLDQDAQTTPSLLLGKPVSGNLLVLDKQGQTSQPQLGQQAQATLSTPSLILEKPVSDLMILDQRGQTSQPQLDQHAQATLSTPSLKLEKPDSMMMVLDQQGPTSQSQLRQGGHSPSSLKQESSGNITGDFPPTEEVPGAQSSKTSRSTRSNVTQRLHENESAAATLSAIDEKVVPLLHDILEVLQTMRDEKYHSGPDSPIHIDVGMDHGIQIPEPLPSPKLTKELLGPTSSHVSNLSAKKKESKLIDLDPPVRDVGDVGVHETSAGSKQRLIPVDMNILRNDEGMIWEPNLILDSKNAEQINLQPPIVPVKTADHQDIPEREIEGISGQKSYQEANASPIPLLLVTPPHTDTPAKVIQDALIERTGHLSSASPLLNVHQDESPLLNATYRQDASPLLKEPYRQDRPEKEVQDALIVHTGQGASASPSQQDTPENEIQDALMVRTGHLSSASPLLKVHQDESPLLKATYHEDASPLLKEPYRQDKPEKEVQDALIVHTGQGASGSPLLMPPTYQDTSSLLKAPSHQDTPEREIQDALKKTQGEISGVPLLNLTSDQQLQQKQTAGEKQKSYESRKHQSGDTNKGQAIGAGGDKPGDRTNRQGTGPDIPELQHTARSDRSDRAPDEMSQFIESIRFDLEAMQNVRKRGILCCQKKSLQPLPCPRVPPGGWQKPSEDLGFPAKIEQLKPFGDSSLFVKWEVKKTNNIAGFEIFLDGYLTNRYFSYIHRAAVICNVNLTCAHRILLRAKPIIACNAVVTASQLTLSTSPRSTGHPEASIKQPDGSIWSPSIFYYEPNNPPSPNTTTTLVPY